MDNVTINGGEVNVTATSNYLSSAYSALGFGFGGNSKDSNVTINGGQVKVTGPTCNNGYGIGAKNISLSHTHSTDSIYASSYYTAPTLNSDFVLQGTETPATPANAGGNTIVPAPVPEIYTVVFYNWDGSEIKTVNVEEGQRPELPDESEILARPRYGFMGWKDKTNGVAFSDDEVITSDRELISDWKQFECEITFDTDEGSELKVFAIEEGDGENSQGESTPVASGSIVPHGTVLDVTATAKLGYELIETPADSITVNEDTVIRVRSKKKTFELTITHENGAEPVVSCSDCPLDKIPYGTQVEVTPGEADEGFEFIGFYRTNGVLLSDATNSSYAFTMLSLIHI